MRCLMKAWPTRLAIALPPSALDRVGHGARGAQVVEDRLAGVLGQHRLGDQRGDEVARHELAGVVDEEAAVGVAVPGDAEVGARALDLADDELRGSPRAAGSAGSAGTCRRARSGSARRAIGRRSRIGAIIVPGHAVGAVEHDLQRRDRVDVDDRRGSARRSPAARRAEPRLPAAAGRAELARQRAVAHLLDAAVAAQRAARRGARSSCRCTAWGCARR